MARPTPGLVDVTHLYGRCLADSDQKVYVHIAEPPTAGDPCGLRSLPELIGQLVERRAEIKPQVEAEKAAVAKATGKPPLTPEEERNKEKAELRKISENSTYGQTGPLERRCAKCRAPKPTKRCGGCHRAKYCNATCQMDDWPVHKHVCISQM